MCGSRHNKVTVCKAAAAPAKSVTRSVFLPVAEVTMSCFSRIMELVSCPEQLRLVGSCFVEPSLLMTELVCDTNDCLTLLRCCRQACTQRGTSDVCNALFSGNGHHRSQHTKLLFKLRGHKAICQA